VSSKNSTFTDVFVDGAEPEEQASGVGGGGAGGVGAGGVGVGGGGVGVGGFQFGAATTTRTTTMLA
jgi:hypothetical protein